MSDEKKMVKIYADVSVNTTVEIEVPEELAKLAEAAEKEKRYFDLAELLMGHEAFRDTVFETDFDIDSFEIVDD